MKKILLTLLLAITTSVTFGQSKKVATAVIKTEIFCDHCSKCSSCGQNIYNKLTENKGVKSVKIEDEINAITVKYKPSKITLAELEKAIANAGYQANETPADGDAYNNLDNCCKKKEN